MDYRVRNAQIFENTTRRCMTEEKLRNAVSRSQKKQRFYPENEAADQPASDNIRLRYQDPARIIVSGKRSFEAAADYAGAGEKVCVLNFASAVNPGGGVLYGASAQEECLCRCSTLYFCLDVAEMREKFYMPHQQAGNYLNNDDIIYTPDVIVFKEDTAVPAALPEEKWYRVDVLTCAAPDLSRYPEHLTGEELAALLEKRIRRILSLAADQGAEVLILGAFGCGAFGNPPEAAAAAFETAVKDYLNEFRTIEFAVYCSPRDRKNYQVFSRIFQPLAEFTAACHNPVNPEESCTDKTTGKTIANNTGKTTEKTTEKNTEITTEETIEKTIEKAIEETIDIFMGKSAGEIYTAESAERSGSESRIIPTEGDAEEAAAESPAYQGSIELVKADITTLSVDCIVNAANEFLQQGGGVCGAIFRAAGADQLQKVCNTYGHCDTGKAIITPGFYLKAAYIIHAVGPVYQGGASGEEKLLYSAYASSLEKAKDFGIHSIAFPLISAGIYGYPKEEAWTIALQACDDFLTNHSSYPMKITFAVLDDEILALGQQAQENLLQKKQEAAIRKKAELDALKELQKMQQEAIRKARLEKADPENKEAEDTDAEFKITESETTESEKTESEKAESGKAESETTESGTTESERTDSGNSELETGKTGQKGIDMSENENKIEEGKDLMDLIRTRRSCRAYKPDAVAKELIDSVIEAGLYAASGMNRQPVIIIAVSNKVLRDKIAALNAKFMGKDNFDPFYGAPVILLVASEACPTATYDGSLALGNMMLRAHDLGLGSCWIHRAYQEMDDEFGKNLLKTLGLEGEYEGIGHLALGYPVEENNQVTPRKEGRVFYIG